jgi:hypothetical protein
LPKRSIWESNIWKGIVALSIILTIIASALQISGAVDFWNLLIIPLYWLFTSSIPIYLIVLFIGAVILILFLLSLIFPSNGSNILDDEYGRDLAMSCQELRTTEYLRRKLEAWKKEDSISGGYSIDDYLKRLENRGYLKYIDGEWRVTDKALDYIEKYHGD